MKSFKNNYLKDKDISVGFRKVRTFSKNFEDNFRKIKFRKKKTSKK